LAGLKGNVKSVVTESAISMLDNEKLETDTRTAISEEFYDKTGNILSDPKKNASNFKIKYIYDNQGKISEERKFDAKGVQFFKTIFKYDAKGQVSETIYYNKNNISANNYLTYDGKGNLTELEFIPTKFNMTNETVIQRFIDYQFDAQGNWTKRTLAVTSNQDGKPTENQTIYYRKIEYYK
jgi:outer membrane lipoprotein-sorting protein